MTTFSIPYGREQLTLIIPDRLQADWIDPTDVLAAANPLDIIRGAIRNPLSRIGLDRFSSAQSVAIAINDKTRPVPHHILLPPLLEKLKELGFKPEKIRFLIATGTHQPMPAFEFGWILPDSILAQYPVISHDCDDRDNLVYLGLTARETTVWVNRTFFNADLRIVVGNIEPHHFAGFSGGYKTAAIGLAGRETINHNHAMLVDPHAQIGSFEENPLRQDIEEIGQKMNVQFALNAILNAKKEVVKAYFGDPAAVMQAGIKASQQISQTEVKGVYDLVIVSAGGHPKDINFYQAQKALTYASIITKEGGTIVLAAACPEGSGSESYEHFMEGVSSYQAVFEKFKKEGFQVGPHKALQVALIASRKRIIVVSQMPPEWVYRFLLIPAPDLQSAFELATHYLPENPKIAILPHATNTIPFVGKA